MTAQSHLHPHLPFPGTLHICASAQHREELMDVLASLRQQSDEYAAEVRKLDAECQRLAGDNLRLKNNAAELAWQLDEAWANYWAVVDENTQQSPPSVVNEWPTACQVIAMVGCLLLGMAAAMAVLR